MCIHETIAIGPVEYEAEISSGRVVRVWRVGPRRLIYSYLNPAARPPATVLAALRAKIEGLQA